jgi:phosphopantothenoylcysteine decarboxylase/phosphopantothenate--cysteine ligase
MRIVVTAGPTRERIDEVRYVGNLSSGRMGFAIASAARERGHSVTLVSGPTELPPPRGVRLVRVESAREMLAALREPFRAADALVMAAAVADYRPRRKRPGKLKKEAEVLRLDLVRNPDILSSLARRKGRRIVMGFALEMGGHEGRGRGKLEKKGLDYVVVNDPSTLSSSHIHAVILSREGERRDLGRKTKQRAAAEIVRILESDHGRRTGRRSIHGR